jgi:hypothetical protein
VRGKDGWDFFYYGNVGGGRRGQPAEGARRWETFDYRPRFNNNYIGLRNRFALLSEAFAYATFEDRIAATNRFLEESLAFAHASAGRIQRIVENADRKTIVGAQLPLRAELQHTGSVEVLMGEVSEEKHPVDGHIMHRRKDVRVPETMADYSTFKGIEPERVPARYYVPATLRDAVDRLNAHGIRMTPVKTATRAQLQEFRIESSVAASTPFQNHNERTLTGGWVPAERDLVPGTLVIDMSQPLARLAFYLIEPRASDGLANWNLLDEALKDAKAYPIVRTRD